MRMKQKQGSGSRLAAFCSLVLCALLLLTFTGCGFGKLKKDLAELAIVGLISGTVSAPGGTGDVYVLLFSETHEGVEKLGTNTLAPLMDTWAFTVHTGVRYYVAGFRDLDGDRLYSPGEPAGLLGDDKPFALKQQTRIYGIPLELKADTVIPHRFTLDARGELLEDDAGVQMVAGDIIDFDDERFTFRRGSTSFMAGSHDTVVSVMSQIPLWAQEEAVRIRGYDEDHESILVSTDAVAELNRILAEVTPE